MCGRNKYLFNGFLLDAVIMVEINAAFTFVLTAVHIAVNNKVHISGLINI